MGFGREITTVCRSLSRPSCSMAGPLAASRLSAATDAALCAARLNRRFAHSPVDALINLVVRCRLRRQIPVWGDIDTVIHLRIAVVPKWWPACRGDGWRLGLHTDVLQDLPDIGTVRDERDDAHLTTADRAYQRKNPVDAGDQHCPQVVRRWAHCAVWRSGRPDRYPLCEGAPWQRVGGRSTSAAAPGQRGRVPGCTHRHPPRSRCAGRPACLWRHSSAAQESKGQIPS